MHLPLTEVMDGNEKLDKLLEAVTIRNAEDELKDVGVIYTF